MAEKTIKHASFWYRGEDGVERTVLRGETVDIADKADLERGERLDAFATDRDLEPGTPFGDWYVTYQANHKAAADAGMPELAQQPLEEVPPAADKPGGNDSREKWMEYARAQGAPDDELAALDAGGLSRDRLREKYGA